MDLLTSLFAIEKPQNGVSTQNKVNFVSSYDPLNAYLFSNDV